MPIIFLSMIGVASYATSVTVTTNNLQTKYGVLQNTYYQTASGPGSTTPSTNTALTPSGSSSSYSIASGTSGYLWSPAFSSATTIPSSRMILDLWASASGPTFGVDGSASASTSTNVITITLTTITANDVLYVSVVEGLAFTVSSVTSSPTLTWTLRVSVAFSSNRHLETWYAIWSASGTITITITMTGSSNAAGVAFGITGANTASPFDGNTALPASNSHNAQTSASVTISTSNAHDFIIGALGVQGNPALTTGSGFSLILTQASGTTRETSDEYQIVSSTQSNLAVSYSWTGNQDWAIIADAVVAAPTVSVIVRTTDSTGALVSTLLSSTTTNSLLSTETQTATIFSISAGSIPAGGYIEVILSAPTSTSITIYWGVGQPTNFQLPRVVAT